MQGFYFRRKVKMTRRHFRFASAYFFSFLLFLALAVKVIPNNLLRALRPNLSVWAFIRNYGLGGGVGFLPPLLSFIWVVGLPLIFLACALYLDFLCKPKGKGWYLAIFAAISAFFIDFSFYPKNIHLILTFIMSIFLRSCFFYEDNPPPKKKKLSPEQKKRAVTLGFIRSLMWFSALYYAVFVALSFLYMLRSGGERFPLLVGSAFWAVCFFMLALFLDFFREPKGRGSYLASFAAFSFPAYDWLSAPREGHLFASGVIFLAFLAVNLLYSILYGGEKPKGKRKNGN